MGNMMPTYDFPAWRAGTVYQLQMAPAARDVERPLLNYNVIASAEERVNGNAE